MNDQIKERERKQSIFGPILEITHFVVATTKKKGRKKKSEKKGEKMNLWITLIRLTSMLLRRFMTLCCCIEKERQKKGLER